MNDKPRLIEVAFPLKQASIASVHEKNVRQGHLSTLHIWPARRPLAACRAALLATLLPDTEDPEKRKALLDRIGGQVVTKAVEETDDDGNTVVEDKEFVQGGVLAWGQEDELTLNGLRAEIKQFHGDRAATVLDPFAGGGAIPLEAIRLGCSVAASDINPVAWLLLKGTLEMPSVCAGRTWPLPEFVLSWADFIEDFRSGKVKRRRKADKSHFSDAQQLRLSELPEADLAWHLRAWGRWILERAKSDLRQHYPAPNGDPTIAYLWSRTARDKSTNGRIPLLKTFLLSKKKGRKVALLPIPSEDGRSVTFKLLRDSDLDNPKAIVEQHPFLGRWGVTAESFEAFLRLGTMNRAGVWSPLSGRPGLIALTMDDLRRQGQQGLLGSQMIVNVVEVTAPNAKKPHKEYRTPTETEVAAANVTVEQLEEIFSQIPGGLPDEALPPVGTLGFRVPLYGFKKWRDMFTPRQLLALGVFVLHTRKAIEEVRKREPELATPIAVGLTIFFGRLADYMSTLALWEPDNGEVKHTFARYAFPITWDFAEANPLSSSSRYYAGGIEVASRVISNLLSAVPLKAVRPLVSRESCLKLGDGPYDLILTDPPYYDAIPYSDLMDFFFIWQKRILPEVFDYSGNGAIGDLSPKWDTGTNDGELVEDESRHGGDKARAKVVYEDGMARAFEKCNAALSEHGRFVAVFANKKVEAWETLVGAMIRAGFVVTASWPIQTEMPNKVTQRRANLSSSVWMVAKKRPRTATPGWEERVLGEMRTKLFDPREALGGRNILQYYFDLGIQGPDFIWAALGPALEAYSAHPYVKKTAGGVMKVDEFLREVRKLVLHFSLGELPGFREVQKETQGRGESLEIDSVTQYYLLHRAYFSLDPAPAGACILFANACGKNETELKVVWNILEQGGKQKKGRPRKEDEDDVEDTTGEAPEGKGNEYRLLAWQERASADGLGENRSGDPAPLIDKLHRLMFLFQQNRTVEVQQLFEAWGLSNEKAFKPLLQAVRELAVRDKQDAERRLVEALATQLRMNRKTIMVANEMKEVPLFDSVEDIGQVLIN